MDYQKILRRLFAVTNDAKSVHEFIKTLLFAKSRNFQRLIQNTGTDLARQLILDLGVGG